MKHDDASYRRWNPKSSWQSIEQFPPPTGVLIQVRRYDDGTPFMAMKLSSGEWRDGTRQALSAQGLQRLMPT